MGVRIYISRFPFNETVIEKILLTVGSEANEIEKEGREALAMWLS